LKYITITIIVEFQFYAQKVIVLAVSRERCVFYVDSMWTSTRGRGQTLVVAIKNLDFLLDVING